MALWLVTGGCGFIGSHLVEALLRRGDRVCVLDDLSSGRRDNLPQGADLKIGDVADRTAVAEACAGIDGCFHLAAVASVERCTRDWLGSHRTNLTGTLTVFDVARESGRNGKPIPVVYASSAAVYGDNPQIPLGEAAATRPLSAYGADKLGCEQHAAAAWTVHGLPSVGLRFFNVFGPRQDPQSPYSGVIAVFAGRIARRAELDIFGDGKQTRDFIYVGDVVDHLLAAMPACGKGAAVYNVCTGHGTSVLDLVEAIGDIAGYRPVVHHRAPRAGDIRASIGDPATAAGRFKITAQTSLIEGLRQTLADGGDRKLG